MIDTERIDGLEKQVAELESTIQTVRTNLKAEVDRMGGLLSQLERAVWDAADAGDALADTVKAGNVEQIVVNLVAHFEAVRKANTAL